MTEGVRDELVVRIDQVDFFLLWFNNALKLFQANALEITLRSMLAHLVRPQKSTLSMLERIRDVCGKNVERRNLSKISREAHPACILRREPLTTWTVHPAGRFFSVISLYKSESFQAMIRNQTTIPGLIGLQR